MPDYGPDAEDPRDQERLENEEDDGSGEELIGDGMQKYAPLSTPSETLFHLRNAMLHLITILQLLGDAAAMTPTALNY